MSTETIRLIGDGEKGARGYGEGRRKLHIVILIYIVTLSPPE